MDEIPGIGRTILCIHRPYAGVGMEVGSMDGKAIAIAYLDSAIANHYLQSDKTDHRNQ